MNKFNSFSIFEDYLSLFWAFSKHFIIMIFTGDMVISYVDSDTLVMYECDLQQTDGSCNPHNRYVYTLYVCQTTIIKKLCSKVDESILLIEKSY